MELAKNQEHIVAIEGYGEGGMGVARIDGRVVFVHGALRGETCRVLILKTLKSVAFAKVLEVIEPSGARVESDCPYFPRCGGGLALYKKALLALDDLVRAGAVKTHSPVLRHRVLRLVAVTQRIRGTKDFLHHDSAAADAREIVRHALLFEAQLLFVAHVAIGAAAAAREVRTVRFNARA